MSPEVWQEAPPPAPGMPHIISSHMHAAPAAQAVRGLAKAACMARTKRLQAASTHHQASSTHEWIMAVCLGSANIPAYAAQSLTSRHLLLSQWGSSAAAASEYQCVCSSLPRSGVPALGRPRQPGHHWHGGWPQGKGWHGRVAQLCCLVEELQARWTCGGK